MIGSSASEKYLARLLGRYDVLLPLEREVTGMLQSLLSLEDDEIEIVLTSVTKWCKGCNVALESEEGRRAIAVAVNLICSRNVTNIGAELAVRMNESRHSANS